MAWQLNVSLKPERNFENIDSKYDDSCTPDTFSHTFDKVVRPLTGLSYCLLRLSKLLNNAATSAYFSISGKHDSMNIKFISSHIGRARGADHIFNNLSGMSSKPVILLQSIFINILYISFTVTLVNVKKLPSDKEFFYSYVTWMVVIFGYHSSEYVVILITRRIWVIEPNFISYGSKILIENIRYFIWMTNDIIIFA